MTVSRSFGPQVIQHLAGGANQKGAVYADATPEWSLNLRYTIKDVSEDQWIWTTSRAGFPVLKTTLTLGHEKSSSGKAIVVIKEEYVPPSTSAILFRVLAFNIFFLVFLLLYPCYSEYEKERGKREAFFMQEFFNSFTPPTEETQLPIQRGNIETNEKDIPIAEAAGLV